MNKSEVMNLLSNKDWKTLSEKVVGTKSWPYKKASLEQIIEVVNRYSNGESCEKICVDTPFGKDAILKYLRDCNVHIKTRRENRFSMGFTINENAFLDTSEPEAAYFLGWLITDGNIRDGNRKQVSLEIKSGDVSILKSLRDYIGNSGKISNRTRTTINGTLTEMVSYSFSYHKISERLLALGLFPRKSMKEKCPEVFLYNRDFWRGAIEGDGYLSKLDSDTKLQLCGSKTFIEQWALYCKSIVPEMNVSIYKGSNKSNDLYHGYSGKFLECKKVLDSLYLGVPEHLRLKRKYDLYVGRYYDGIDPNGPS